MMNRRTFCSASVTLASSWALADEPPRDVAAHQDFEELWRTLDERYCYFGEKSTDWRRVREVYGPLAAAATTDEEFIGVIDDVLAELYDPHTHLSSPPAGRPRYAGYDLVVEPEGPIARVIGVRDDSAASAAGIVPGEAIISVDGRPLVAAAAGHLPKCLRAPDPEAVRYAWNVAVAGRRGQGRRFVVRTASGAEREALLPDSPRTPEEDVTSRSLEGDLGFIRISTFAERGSVEKVDAALLKLADARGLIIDVRRNGGGDTAVARPIMGRFITERRPYARMRRRDGAGLGPAWTEYVEPRGPFTFKGPVVVLADYWSGSMAEGFPMGMRAVAGARIVGTPMARLGAAVFGLRLDRTGLSAQYSGEPVYDIHDVPRSSLRPDVAVAPGQDVLLAGITELSRLVRTR